MAARKPRRAPRRRRTPMQAAGAAVDLYSRQRAMGPWESLGRFLDIGLATLVLAVTVSDEDLRAAGGDLVEAMNQHKCGPECWHAIGETPKERQAWWNAKMKAYDAKKRTR